MYSILEILQLKNLLLIIVYRNSISCGVEIEVGMNWIEVRIGRRSWFSFESFLKRVRELVVYDFEDFEMKVYFTNNMGYDGTGKGIIIFSALFQKINF